jgi:hypothetical protein
MTRETRPRSLDSDDFQTFTQVSKGLPDIKPRTVQKKLEALYETLRREKLSEGSLNGLFVTLGELEELYHTTLRTGYETNVVSPAGARALVRLYKAGALANPETIVEAEFTWSLLNAVFFRHGKDTREMVVGGRPVSKHLHPFRSNSGKSTDFNVTFTWKSTDGTARQLEKQSLYESNRRNDEDRNWGLPE